MTRCLVTLKQQVHKQQMYQRIDSRPIIPNEYLFHRLGGESIVKQVYKDICFLKTWFSILEVEKLLTCLYSISSAATSSSLPFIEIFFLSFSVKMSARTLLILCAALRIILLT